MKNIGPCLLMTEVFSFFFQERRNVFTDTNQLHSEFSTWILEQVPNSQDYYRIRNEANGEYLYAAANDLTLDSLRRRVFTWIEEDSDLNTWQLSGDWRIYHQEKGYVIENR